METLYSHEEKRRSSRIPILRIEILECLATRGPQSKSTAKNISTKHHYPDVSRAFDALQHSQKIQVAKLAKLPEHHGGRPEKFYEITDNGLEYLIHGIRDPEKFWTLLAGYCLHSHNMIPLAKVEQFYRIFSHKYLKYSPEIPYFLQLDHVNAMCSAWLRKNGIITKQGKIGIQQKIIESLALEPKIPIKKLASLVGEPEEAVKKVLSRLTFTPIKLHAVGAEFATPYSSGVIPEQYADQYQIFLKRSLVSAKQQDRNQKETIFELTTYGIILALALVRSRETSGMVLLHNDISYQDYYDKIASNYTHKLPLIFGKWQLVKKYMNLWAYYNFDCILSKDVRSKAMEVSAAFGGNKEFQEGFKIAATHSREQLIEILLAGYKAIREYGHIQGEPHDTSRLRALSNQQAADKSSISKIDVVYQKLRLLDVWLSTPGTTTTTTTAIPGRVAVANWKDRTANERTVSQKVGNSEIDIIEKVFAAEITFFYYLSLHHDWNIETLGHKDDYWRFRERVPSDFTLESIQKQFPDEYNDRFSLLWAPDVSAKERLFAILSHDKEIREAVARMVKDTTRSNKEASDNMERFLEEIEWQ